MGFKACDYNDGGGAHIDRERRMDRRPGLSVVIHNKRFCEYCRCYKPRRGPSFTGWKCSDCMGNGEC